MQQIKIPDLENITKECRFLMWILGYLNSMWSKNSSGDEYEMKRQSGPIEDKGTESLILLFIFRFLQ